MTKEEILTDIYFTIRDLSGWVTTATESCFDPREIEYLERLDDEFSSYDSKREAEKCFSEVDRGGGYDIFFLDNDEEKLKFLSKKLFEIDSEIKLSIRFHHPLHTKSCLSEYEETKKLFKKIRGRNIHKGKDMDWEIPEWKIQKARSKPLNEYLGLEEKARIQCPFHKGEDKNFSLSKGFGYCFVCNEWSDAIKWVQVIEHKSFKEAVEILCNS